MEILKQTFYFRWVSLIIVMSGVALVGYSGSLIKDAVKEAVVHHLARALNLPHDPSKKAIEEPEVTRVLVGMSQIKSPLLIALIYTCRCPRDFLCFVRPNFVSSLCPLMPNTFLRFLHPSLSTATQFVVEGMSQLMANAGAPDNDILSREDNG